jgi:predicted DNA binding CopG/RHH family protein
VSSINKTVQYFTDEQLERCKSINIEERLRFLDQYRQLHGSRAIKRNNPQSKLISIKVPTDLLEAFRTKCEIDNVKYQTKIKALMKASLV